MTAVTLALSVLTSLRTGEHFLWAWSAMLLASFPAGILIAYAKPFSALARRLYRAGAAIAGWQGARILSGEAGLIVEDADLFPPQNALRQPPRADGHRLRQRRRADGGQRPRAPVRADDARPERPPLYRRHLPPL